MRTKFIVGNWKMHTNSVSAVELAMHTVAGLKGGQGVRVAICPPFPYLASVAKILKGSGIALGAQNMFPEKEGAFTGEVSPAMLLDVGCEYVILGHSERRKLLGESDAFINQKVKMALMVGLKVIFCIGETLEQLQAKQTSAVLEQQLTRGLLGLSADSLPHLTVAYEPVWAIGSAGHLATAEQAQDAHAVIRHRFGQLFGGALAKMLCIQYGGSVEPENAATMLGQSDVDGALIGGASLDSEQFMAIVRAAINAPTSQSG